MQDLIEKKITETLQQVKTVSDQIMMREVTEVLEASVYRKDGGKTEKILSEILSENLYQAAKKIMSDPALGGDQDFDEYLSGLKERLQNMKVLHFEVVFEPDEGQIVEITDWILRELGENIVIDFYLNPSIVGGAVVIYEGEYFDFTMSAILERNFEKSWVEVTKERSL